MNKKYIHGSKDSIDKDVFYVFETMPSFNESKNFCDADKTENRNIIVIKNGFVIDCFKGTCDEIQNSLINTYKNHEQKYPLLITDTVDRDIMLKMIRVVRCFLSHFSKTKYRKIVKSALISYDWGIRLDAFSQLDLSIDDFVKNDCVEVRKVFAFQLAQILGLFEGIEIYCKQSASLKYPDLKPYLYRDKIDSNNLIKYYELFLNKIKDIKYIQENVYVNFIDYNKYDLKNEKRVWN